MSVIEFHADDLLDREIRGALSPDDRRALEEHLERCATCRLERQLRSDFDCELGPRAESQSLQMFVSGAMRVARVPRTGKAQERTPRHRLAASISPKWRRRFFMLGAAAMIFGTGVAVARTGLPGRTWNVAREVTGDWFGASSVPDLPSHPSSAARAMAAPTATAADPEGSIHQESIEPEDSLQESTLIPLPSIDTADPSETKAALPARAATHAPSLDSPPAAPPGQSAAPSIARAIEPVALPVDTASGLFERANIARRQGNAIEASSLYRDLEADFPQSREAMVSFVIVARMQLDRRETAAALQGFEAYARTGDLTLREEAMEGRAIALQRLGRAAEEKEAWQDLLRLYPRSAYGAVARKRLGQDVP